MICAGTRLGTRMEPMTKPIRIMIAERQARVRFALRVALEQIPGSKTFGEASSAEDLVAQACTTCPDLAILAWESADRPIPEVIGPLRRECPDARVIVLGTHREMCAAALLAGADAFVCMCDAPDELMSAVQRCLGGGPGDRKA